MLGRGEPTVVELGDYENYFIQNVGYWIFGVYNCAIVIVLLNMLIAMMSQSFEIIQVDLSVLGVFVYVSVCWEEGGREKKNGN